MGKQIWPRPHKEYYQAQCRTHGAVRNAILSGRLVRSESCAWCGSSENIIAHHRDYAFPLDVEWICASCNNSDPPTNMRPT